MILKKIYWRLGFRNEALFHFLVGIFFALAGIMLSKLIFSQNIGLVAVFLISLASISLVDREINISETLLGRLKRLPNKIFIIDEIITVQHTITLKSIYDDHKNLFKTYLFLFLGIMACFSLLTLMLPIEQSTRLFGEQFKIISSQDNVSGSAVNLAETFTGILVNNFFVLIAGFFLALLFEYGTTFIIVWNASVWGTAFALAAKTPWVTLNADPFVNFLFIMLIVFPHLVLEIVSYFSSTIAGGLLNKAIISEKINSIRFKIIATHSVLLFVFGLLVLGVAALVEMVVILGLD